MAGGPYNIPRNTKGEGRFLSVFTPKALIVTAVLGGSAYFVFKLIYGNNWCRNFWIFRICNNII